MSARRASFVGELSQARRHFMFSVVSPEREQLAKPLEEWLAPWRHADYRQVGPDFLKGESGAATF